MAHSVINKQRMAVQCEAQQAQKGTGTLAQYMRGTKKYRNKPTMTKTKTKESNQRTDSQFYGVTLNNSVFNSYTTNS